MSNKFYPALQSVTHFYLPIVIIHLNSTGTVATKRRKSTKYVYRKIILIRLTFLLEEIGLGQS